MALSSELYFINRQSSFVELRGSLSYVRVVFCSHVGRGDARMNG